MRWVLVVWLLVLPATVFGQVTVRTGEHSAYTRIVLTMPPGTIWRVGLTEEGYGIAFEGDLSIDPGGFFDRIPRDRISDIKVNAPEAALMLKLDCDCGVQAFQWQPDKLVVDIQDAPPEPSSVFLRPLFPALPAAPKMETTLTQAAGGNRTDAGLPDWLLSPNRLRPVDTPFGTDDLARADVDALEEEVISSLARAASQGLLTPSGQSVSGPPSPMAQETVDQPADANTSPPEPAAVTPGITIQSSVDRALGGTSAGAMTQNGERCWPDQWFDFANWGDDSGFSAQIGPLRTRVTQEFDKIETRDVIALAQAYIYFGFGREAQQVLQLAQERSRLWFALNTLAQIIDDDPVDPPVPQKQMSCESSVAFWAFLSKDQRDLRVAIDRQAIIRTFRALPLHLQLHLAPRVSDRFLALGDVAAAEVVLTNTSREAEPTIDGTLAQIQVTVARGETQAATLALESMAAENARMTPEALLELLTLNLANEIKTPSDLLALSAAMRFESAGTPIAGDLAVAEFESYLSNREFDQAQALMTSASAEIGETRGSILQDSFAMAVAEFGPDDLFLDLAFTALHAGVSNDSQNLIAARLLEIGFPERAAEIIAGSAIGTSMMERRYLRAQAAIDQGQGADVESILAGVTSPRAGRLRREIAAREEGFQLAASVRDTSDAASPDDAWRFGNWQSLADTDDPLLRAATGLVLETTPTVVSTSAPLEQGRSLLEQSAQARAVLDELLARFEGPNTEGSTSN